MLTPISARFLSVLSMLLLSVSTYAETLIVDLPSSEVSLQYSSPVRLEQVLSDARDNTPPGTWHAYPLGHRLFNQHKQREARQQKQQVINRLNDALQDNPWFTDNTEQKRSIGMLLENIKQWNVGYRETLSLDYDDIRIHPRHNPQLSGHFTLIAGERTPSIQIEGLLFSPHQVAFDANKSVSDYLAPIQAHPSAHKSKVWVIYPDGEIERVGYAYWNDQRTALAPGSVLFLGFDVESGPLYDLEPQLVRLLSMRK